MIHDDVSRIFIANNQPPLPFQKNVKGMCRTRPTPSSSIPSTSRSSRKV